MPPEETEPSRARPRRAQVFANGIVHEHVTIKPALSQAALTALILLALAAPSDAAPKGPAVKVLDERRADVLAHGGVMVRVTARRSGTLRLSGRHLQARRARFVQHKPKRVLLRLTSAGLRQVGLCRVLRLRVSVGGNGAVQTITSRLFGPCGD